MARGRARRWVACALAVAASSLIFGCAPGVSAVPGEGVTVTNDPDQPLRYGVTDSPVPDGRDWTRMVSWWTSDEPRTSFGFHVCLSEDTAAVINSVSALKSVGRVEELPALVLTTSIPNQVFISQSGYPPQATEDVRVSPIASERITARCGEDTSYQGVIVGLEALDDAGGGWLGVRINYTVAGDDHTLEVPADILMCGTATEPCGE